MAFLERLDRGMCYCFVALDERNDMLVVVLGLVMLFDAQAVQGFCKSLDLLSKPVCSRLEGMQSPLNIAYGSKR